MTAVSLLVSCGTPRPNTAADSRPTVDCDSHQAPGLGVMRNELTVAVEIIDPVALVESARPDDAHTLGGHVWDDIQVRVLTPDPNIDVDAPATVSNVWVATSRFTDLQAAGIGPEHRLVASIGPTTAWRDWWFMGFATVTDNDQLEFTDTCSDVSVKAQLVTYREQAGHATELDAFIH